MSLHDFSCAVWDCERTRGRMIEMRGGCYCCVSPPCGACDHDPDEDEANELGWVPLPDEEAKRKEWLARAEAKCAASTGSAKTKTVVKEAPADACPGPLAALTPDQQRESRALSVTAPNTNDRWQAGCRLGGDR